MGEDELFDALGDRVDDEIRAEAARQRALRGDRLADGEDRGHFLFQQLEQHQPCRAAAEDEHAAAGLDRHALDAGSAGGGQPIERALLERDFIRQMDEVFCVDNNIFAGSAAGGASLGAEIGATAAAGRADTAAVQDITAHMVADGESLPIWTSLPLFILPPPFLMRRGPGRDAGATGWVFR